MTTHVGKRVRATTQTATGQDARRSLLARCRRPVFSLLAASAVVGLVARVALAGPNDPLGGINTGLINKATSIPGPACTSPTTTTGDGAPACAAASGDGICLPGSIKVDLKWKKGAPSATAVISKLDAGCEGQTLGLVAQLRITRSDCAVGNCTVPDKTVSIGTCVVTKKTCKTANPSFLSPANIVHIDVLRTSVAKVGQCSDGSMCSSGCDCPTGTCTGSDFIADDAMNETTPSDTCSDAP